LRLSSPKLKSIFFRAIPPVPAAANSAVDEVWVNTRSGTIRIPESKGVRAIDAPEIVHPCLFPEFRRSGNQRKTKADPSHPEQFRSDNQIGHYDFFNDARYDH